MLLARQSRLRLDAEIIRDAALAASGLLDERIGGPSVFPPQPDGAMAASQVKKDWVASKGPDRYRRGMYTHFWRVTPHPALVVFDQPNAMTACTRRVAHQHSAAGADAAQRRRLLRTGRRAWRSACLREAPADNAGRIDYAMRLAVGRKPDAVERERLAGSLAAELDEYKTRPEAAEKLGGPELAAWTAVSRVLMNTDEFITRE